MFSMNPEWGTLPDHSLRLWKPLFLPSPPPSSLRLVSRCLSRARLHELKVGHLAMLLPTPTQSTAARKHTGR